MKEGSILKRLPPTLRAGFLQYHYRRRSYRALQIFLSSTVLYLVLVWLAIHVDRFIVLTTLERIRLFQVVHGVVGVLGLVRLLVLFARPCPVREIAYILEDKVDPSIQERYSTLVELLGVDGPGPRKREREFLEQLADETVHMDLLHRTGKFAGDWTLHIWGVLNCLVLLSFVLPSAFWSYEMDLMLQRFYQPYHELSRPSFVRIEATPTSDTVGRGREFVLQVRTFGAIPPVWIQVLSILGRDLIVSPEIQIATASAGPEDAPQHQPVTRIGEGQYIYARTDVQENFRFRVFCGDASTEWFTVEAVPVPEITEIRLHVKAPDYSGEPSQTIVFSGQALLFLKGSRIQIVFKTDDDVSERSIFSNIMEKPIEPEWDSETRTGSYRFVLRDKMSLQIKVANERGMENADPPIISFKLLEDQSPSVHLKTDGIGSQRSAIDQVTLPFLAEDDYGISELAVSYIVNPMPGQEEGAEEYVLPLQDSRKRISDVATFDLRTAGVYPGDQIRLRVRARDKAGQSGFSQDVLITISSFGRGSREEIRIKTLRFLVTALESASESERKGTEPETLAYPISEGIYRTIPEKAEAEGIGLSKSASFQSLIELLLREHFLTASPWDKEDLRRVATALTLSISPDLAESSPIAFRNDQVIRMIETVLVPSLDHRELKNIMWRVYGLRDAVTVLLKAPSKSEKERQKLIFSTLEGVLTRLLNVSTRIQSLDGTQVRSEIKALAKVKVAILGGAAPSQQEFYSEPSSEFGETYEDAPPAEEAVKPASGPTLKAGLTQLSASLERIILLAQGGIQETLQGHQMARHNLVENVNDLWSRQVAVTPPEPEYKAWWQRTMAILTTDTRLAQANPYLPLWVFYRNHMLSRKMVNQYRLREAAASQWQQTETKRKALLKKKQDQKKDILPSDTKPTPKPQPQAHPVWVRQTPMLFKKQRKTQDELYIYSERLALDRLPYIHKDERTLAIRLMAGELEQRHQEGTNTLSQPTFQVLSQKGVKDSLGWNLGDPESVCRDRDAYIALECELAQTILEQVAWTSIVAEASHVNAAFADTKSHLQDKALVKSALLYERQALRTFVERIYWELSIPCGTNENPIARESLYLKLREFRDRQPVSLHQLAEVPGEGQLSPKHFDDIDMDFKTVRKHRDVVLRRLNGFLTLFKEGHDQELDDYQRGLVEQMERTAVDLRTCVSLSATENRAAIAKDYISTSEEATLVYISSTLSLLQDAVQQLQKIQARARKRPASTDDWRAMTTRAREMVAAYEKVYSLTQPSVFKEHIITRVRSLATGIRELESVDAGSDTAIYETDALIRKTEDLLRELALHSAHVTTLRFRGGTLLTADPLSPIRIYETARFLARDVELQRKQVSAGIFEVLSDRPQLDISQMSVLHAALIYRMVRGEVVKFKSAEPLLAQRGIGSQGYIQLLQNAINNALQVNMTQYGDTVRPYLSGMRSYKWQVIPKKQRR